MGWRLANEVLDNAPDDLGPAERLVLSVLAGYVVDEETRTCWPGMDKLVRRTGLKPDSLRKVFQRLARRGLDPRVAIGKDKKGNLVFAHESARTTYRIPRFESRDEHPATDPVEAGPSSHHSEPRGGTVIPQRRDDDPPEEGQPSRPEDSERSGKTLSSSVPGQATAQQPPAAPKSEREKSAALDKTTPTKAQEAVRASGLLRPAEEDAFIAWATAKFRIYSPGWWVKSAADLPEHVAAWRADPKRTAAAIPDWCEQCGDNNPAARFNSRFRVIRGGGKCPNCHPDMVAA
jgi:hypothetical protein